MGAEVTVGALLGAAALSAAGSVAGSAISSSQASATNEDTMDFNREEAEKARNWQEKMYNKQLTDQRENYEMFQSPAAIAKYLQNAGLNPAKILSNGSGGFGSLGSVPSVPSSQQASVAGLQNPGAAWQNTFSQVGGSAVDIVNSIADKNLKDSQAVKLLADKASVEAQTRLLNWQDMINNTVGNEKVRAELNNIVAQTVMYETTGEYNKAQTLVAETIKRLNEKKFDIDDETLSQLKTRGLYLVQSLKNEQLYQQESIKTQKSMQAQNYASAENQRAQASYTRNMAEIYNDKSVKASMKSQIINAAVKARNEGKMSAEQLKQLKYYTEQAEYANDMKEFTYWSQQASSLVQSVGSIVGSVAAGSAAYKFLTAPAANPLAPKLESGQGYYMDGGLLFKR